MANFDYESLVVDIPDYPEPGVIFKDVTPLIGDARGLAAIVDEIANHFMDKGITKVVGAEARGFMVGAPIAYRLNCGFVPARKPGKLPRAVYSESYALEYGTDELQIHQDAISPDDRVLIVDDLIATGGTAIACAKMTKKIGADFVGFAFIMELAFLKPREILANAGFNEEVFTLFKVE